MSFILVACNDSDDAFIEASESNQYDKQDTSSATGGSEYFIEKLKPIRDYVAKIDAIKEWSLVLKKDIFYTTEGGEATFFNWNGKLEKVKTIEYGETFQKHTRYYLRNDSLLVVYEKFIEYNRPIYHDSIGMKESGDDEVFDFKKSKIIETESYFEHGKLNLFVVNKVYNDALNEEYRTKERNRIFENLRKLKNVYKGK